MPPLQVGLLPALLAWLILVAYAQGANATSAAVRAEVKARTDAALAEFIAENPGLEAELAAAPGYLVGTGDTLLLGPLGSGGAIAVLRDQRRSSDTYLDISSLGLGVGLGSRGGRFLAVINSTQLLDSLQRGRWLLNSEASSNIGEQGGSVALHSDQYVLYSRGESGAAIGAGLNLSHIEVNKRLTDTGLSESTVPGRTRAYAAGQGDNAPRRWPYALPFLAQKVIDRGINLPRPYGVGWIRANMNQAMSLTHLDVGFNGATKLPYDFVAVNNAQTDIVTDQIKFDAWVLPFLNLYATLGKVEGHVDMDITVDGDTLLDSLGADCSHLLRPPVCYVFSDRAVTFPVRAHVGPTTYGGGMVLAGAWHDWVVIVPSNISYSEASDKTFDGRTITVSPRLGRLIDLPRAGSLTVFTGGNYLDSKNVIDGTYRIPGTAQELGYRIHQRNQDPWSALVGMNWDISARLSLMLQYEGFSGSREGFTSSLTVRF
ncbi:hypothetical protein [Gilvimarinus sp. DA14]|uniref:hypothetical protein n=1 Tax=Gilvimarinus sp. DA14 TaxID=2956798 RepID=UPI0020B84E0B|nr:hypothetical protein [Gilvimarinus sp. DA14]UTF61194.1 hypothetical protein NHM04_05180 [Gilvimarinus sp. DA14]